MANLNFDDGILIAAATLVNTHDQPGMAADIIKEIGLEAHDCTNLDEFDKKHLRKINLERGMQLKGL